MQRRRIIWGLVFGIVILGVVALFALRPPQYAEIKLPDGTVLRVEKIVFGKRGEFTPPLSWMQKLKRLMVARLPQRWTRSLSVPSNMGSWWYNTTVHTNTDAIHIWVTQRNPVTGVYTRM